MSGHGASGHWRWGGVAQWVARKARREAVFEKKRQSDFARANRLAQEPRFPSGGTLAGERGDAMPVRGTPGVVQQQPPPDTRVTSALASLSATEGDSSVRELSSSAVGDVGGTLRGREEPARELPGLPRGNLPRPRPNAGGGGGPRQRRRGIVKKPRSAMFPNSGEASPDLGLDPKLAGLRRDVLALLSDGHRIEQVQARMLTDMLRRALESSGRVQRLRVRAEQDPRNPRGVPPGDTGGGGDGEGDPGAGFEVAA